MKIVKQAVMEKFLLQECKKAMTNENSKTKRNPKTIVVFTLVR
jgi:hypothetical protein